MYRSSRIMLGFGGGGGNIRYLGHFSLAWKNSSKTRFSPQDVTQEGMCSWAQKCARSSNFKITFKSIFIIFIFFFSVLCFACGLEMCGHVMRVGSLV